MNVRGAGGLVLAPLLAVIAFRLDLASVRPGTDIFDDVIRPLFWTDADAEGRDVVVAIVRDVLMGVVLVTGLLGLAGLALSRLLVPFVSFVLMACYLPWVIWDTDFTDPPPEWVYRNVPWFPAGRITAIMWIMVLAVAFLLAITDRSRPARSPAMGAGSATPATWGPPPATDPMGPAGPTSSDRPAPAFGPTRPGDPPPPQGRYPGTA